MYLFELKGRNINLIDKDGMLVSIVLHEAPRSGESDKYYIVCDGGEVVELTGEVKEILIKTRVSHLRNLEGVTYSEVFEFDFGI